LQRNEIAADQRDNVEQQRQAIEEAPLVARARQDSALMRRRIDDAHALFLEQILLQIIYALVRRHWHA
jgi:hypothetical protein